MFERCITIILFVAITVSGAHTSLAHGEDVYYSLAGEKGVIICFHGSGGSGAGWAVGSKKDYLEKALQAGYSFVCPTSTDRLSGQWNSETGEGNVDVASVDKLLVELGVPTSTPLLLIGVSNGGGFTSRYAISSSREKNIRAVHLAASDGIDQILAEEVYDTPTLFAWAACDQASDNAPNNMAQLDARGVPYESVKLDDYFLEINNQTNCHGFVNISETSLSFFDKYLYGLTPRPLAPQNLSIRGSGLRECHPGDSRACKVTGALGACSLGTQSCSTGGAWGICRPEHVPSAEVCWNDIDEDCDGLVNKSCSEQITPVWANQVGETDEEVDQIDGLAVDSQYNVIISGIFENEIFLEELEVETEPLTPDNGDIFLLSYGLDGDINWSKTFGSIGGDNTFDLTTDSKDNIILSGWASEGTDFGGGAPLNRGGTDMFIAKFAKDGTFLWNKTFGGPGADGGNEIYVAENNEIAASGISEGVFEGVPNAGGRDSHIFRLSPDGDIRWMTSTSGTGSERVRAISIDESGNIYAGFQFTGELRIGATAITAIQQWDGALAKFRASNGELEWLLHIGGPGLRDENVRGVGVGSDGTVYASGTYNEGAQIFQNGQIVRPLTPYGNDGTDFVLKVSPDGTVEWLLTVGGEGTRPGAEIIVDHRGPIISAAANGRLDIRVDDVLTETIDPPGGHATSYLLGFDKSGRLRFRYLPRAEPEFRSPGGGSLDVSPDGRYIVQDIRFSGKLTLAGKELTNISRDPALVLLEARTTVFP